MNGQRSILGALQWIPALALALPLCSAAAQNAPPARGEATPAVSPAQAFELKVDSNRLTFKGTQAPLHEVLKELARQAEMKIQLPAYLAQQEVSMAIVDMPMERGIKRLMEGNSYTVLYEAPRPSRVKHYETTAKVNYRAAPDIGAQRLGSVEAGRQVLVTGLIGDWFRVRLEAEQHDGVFMHRDYLRSVDKEDSAAQSAAQGETAPLRIVEIQVLSTGTRAADADAQRYITFSPPSPEVAEPQLAEPTGGVDPDVLEAVEDLLSQASAATGPKEKLAAIYSASAIGAADPRVHDLMVSSLRDPDPGVRRGALQSLEAMGIDIPLEPIASMASRDSSPELRIYAMTVIANNFPPDAAVGVLHGGARDSDPSVSAAAKRLLREVDR